MHIEEEQKQRYAKKNGGRRSTRNSTKSTPSSSSSTTTTTSSHNHEKGFLLSSIIHFIYKLIFILMIITVAFMFVLAFLTTTNAANNDDNTTTTDILLSKLMLKNSSFAIYKTSWENIKMVAKSVYFATTASPDQVHHSINSGTASGRRREKTKTMDRVELGRTLLRSGDPVGAEKLCKGEIENYKQKKHQVSTSNSSSGSSSSGDDDKDEDGVKSKLELEANQVNHINALICLGESRLSLHNAAWNSGVILDSNKDSSSSSSSSSSSDTSSSIISSTKQNKRLHLAKDNFDEAVELDPTNLNARHGLGLTYFLIATRELDQYRNQKENQHRHYLEQTYTQLLFNSILHFEAISVLAASPYYSSASIKSSSDDDTVDNEIENLRISAMYNNGLAYIAMNDIKSAIPILNELSKVLEMKNESTSIQYKGLLSSVKTNLGAALLQRNAADQALKVMDSSSVIKYCKPEGIDVDEFVSLPYWKQRHIQKQCSILSNNIAVANERIGNDDDDDDENENDDGINSERSFLELSLIYEHMLGLESPSFAATNAMAKHVGKPQLTMTVDYFNNAPKIGVVNKNAKLKSIFNDVGGGDSTHHNTVDDWLKSSSNKLDTGDVEGAADVARRALNQATNLDEIKRCTDALQSALGQTLTTNDEKGEVIEDEVETPVSTTGENNNESKILDLEEEVAQLKLRLEEQTSKQCEGGGAFFNTAKESESIRNEDEESSSSLTEVDIKVETLQELLESQKKEKEDLIVYHDDEEISLPKNDRSDPSTVRSNDNTENEEEEEEEATISDSETPLVETGTGGPQSEDLNETLGSFERKVDDKKESVVIDETHTSKERGNKTERDLDLESVMNVNEEIVLPALYQPVKKDAEEIDASADGYMKVANAYIQKQNYKLASKQFLKVLKKQNNHIPALLGYATSIERHVKPKQMKDVAMAYVNVTVSALEQGNLKLATATFQRSLKVSDSLIEGEERIELLRHLATICFNEDLAAQVNYDIGLEMLKMKSPDSDVISAFKISNGFGTLNDNIYSALSKFQIAKIKSTSNDNLEGALQLVLSALGSGMGDLQVDALVLSGELKQKLSNVDGAIKDYEKAIEFPKTDATATAHYNLGLAKRSKGGDVKAIEKHIELALNLGLDPTAESIEILGEHHIAIVKSAHRAEWNQYKKTLTGNDKQQQGGGIMSESSSISNESVFARKDEEANVGNLDPLAMLEQGAAAYDGSSVPSGDEAEDETSNLPNHQRSTSSKVNTK